SFCRIRVGARCIRVRRWPAGRGRCNRAGDRAARHGEGNRCPIGSPRQAPSPSSPLPPPSQPVLVLVFPSPSPVSPPASSSSLLSSSSPPPPLLIGCSVEDDP